eukprot:COSAG02_NODE_22877_length_737_cov_1.076803_1_plen_24_part_10
MALWRAQRGVLCQLGGGGLSVERG